MCLNLRYNGSITYTVLHLVLFLQIDVESHKPFRALFGFLIKYFLFFIIPLGFLARPKVTQMKWNLIVKLWFRNLIRNEKW